MNRGLVSIAGAAPVPELRLQMGQLNLDSFLAALPYNEYNVRHTE
jgi:hypothetical protein